MFDELIDWARDNKENFRLNGINTVKDLVNEHGVCIAHETKNCMGQVAVNKEGHFDIEIYEINSGIKLMQSNFAFQKKFNEDLISSYIRILLESTKQIPSSSVNI